MLLMGVFGGQSRCSGVRVEGGVHRGVCGGGGQVWEGG